MYGSIYNIRPLTNTSHDWLHLGATLVDGLNNLWCAAADNIWIYIGGYLIYVCVCICIYICIYMCLYMYLYIYIYI